MARDPTVTKLSKSILEMKFMKKTKDKVEKEIEDQEGRAMYSHEITREMKQGAGSFIIEPSFVPCEDLLVGRLSYRGMNPEIERLMELEEQENNRLLEKQRETEISDKEMAAFHNPLVNSMNKRFFKRSHDHLNDDNCQDSKRGSSPNNRSRYKNRTDNKYEDNCDSPSVGHKNKKMRFLKPSDN